ncbi:MAG TPA: LysE family transporter [Anaerolineales bacterium]
MWNYLLQGLGYGFAAAVQPGPFLAYIISQTLARGWKRTLPAAFAPLLSDGPIILVSLLLLSQVPAWLERALHLLGGGFILYLAYGTYRTWRAFDVEVVLNSTPASSIWKAALMNTLNLNPYIYWTLVSGPILLRGWRETPLRGAVFLGAFYGVMILCIMLIILVFGTARSLGPRFNRFLLGLSCLALAGFGLYQLWLGMVPAQ